MKSKFFLIVVLVLFFSSTSLRAESKTAFIDIDSIVNKSNIGIKLIKKIEISETNLKNKFLSKELILKKKEKELIDQKNIISKKLIELKEDINKFKQDREKERKKLFKTRNDYNFKLLEAINPILITYSKDNNISILLQKKSIILGSAQLDITNDILKIVNKKITESNIK